ncbi:PadR family transcriptional regulator [Acrocarpospora catenulata]|uniref:PadR family transcriptional regulator n=1 Tax=Acrocarpospora catenulata TaxID=2836182 RepID=UPI001BD9921D|nr:PadR family transcriptional regulator [Acrocarpospora catenulata]
MPAALSQLHTSRYGYELRQSLSESGMPIEEGTLYPLLRRLEAQGVLTNEWRTDGGAPRRYYVLSEGGRELYERLTGAWRGLNDTMDLLLKGGEERPADERAKAAIVLIILGALLDAGLKLRHKIQRTGMFTTTVG